MLLETPDQRPILELLTRTPSGETRRTVAIWDQDEINEIALGDWIDRYNRKVSGPDSRWQREIGYAPIAHHGRIHWLNGILAEWAKPELVVVK